MLICQISMRIIPHQTKIPTDLLITSYRPDIAICNTLCLSVTFLEFELTFPLDSIQHIQAAMTESRIKCVEHLQLLAWPPEHLQLLWHNRYTCARTLPTFHSQKYVEFDNVIIILYYLEVKPSRSAIKGHLDTAASASRYVGFQLEEHFFGQGLQRVKCI